MSARPKILAFAGSTRKDSWNKKLLKEAAEGVLGEGVEVTFIDLADYPLPLYDGDFEAASGLPENAKKLQALFAEHDGFLISSPDYNGSYPAVVKNVIDWVSRKDKTLATPLQPLTGKTAAILAAVPGMRGGFRSVDKLRDLLEYLEVSVVPSAYVLNSVRAAFNDAGKLKDPETAKAVKNVGAKLAKAVKKL